MLQFCSVLKLAPFVAVFRAVEPKKAFSSVLSSILRPIPFFLFFSVSLSGVALQKNTTGSLVVVSLLLMFIVSAVQLERENVCQ